jgi:3,2-trans-enoyl-CoA isomerase
MQVVAQELQEAGILVLTLQRGRSNALDTALLEELAQTVQQAAGNAAVRALVLTGQPGFFSAGVDLPELYAADEPAVRRFWSAFLHMMHTLAAFPKPFVAAISGHSPAGGCIMALCADYRLMAEGDFRIGLNEISAGIPVPEPVFALYAFCIGERKAYRFLLESRLLLVTEALEAGLVDQVVPQAQLLPEALQYARQLLQWPPDTWQQSKYNLRESLLQKLHSRQGAALEALLQQWWLPETRAALEQLIRRFSPVQKNVL